VVYGSGGVMVELIGLMWFVFVLLMDVDVDEFVVSGKVGWFVVGWCGVEVVDCVVIVDVLYWFG